MNLPYMPLKDPFIYIHGALGANQMLENIRLNLQNEYKLRCIGFLSLSLVHVGGHEMSTSHAF